MNKKNVKSTNSWNIKFFSKKFKLKVTEKCFKHKKTTIYLGEKIITLKQFEQCPVSLSGSIHLISTSGLSKCTDDRPINLWAASLSNIIFYYT